MATLEQKASIAAGMLVHGEAHPVTAIRSLPSLDDLKEVGKGQDELLTILKDARHKQRWAKIERDLDWG